MSRNLKTKIKHYNIMTSCDGNLIDYVSIQLYTMWKNLKDSIIDFYLFHRGIDENNIKILETLCNHFQNITFHSVIVTDPEKYDMIASHGGGWAGEAYFPLCAHQLLPDTINRILYIDAGDVIIYDDISPYYRCDFEDNAIIATSIRYKEKDGQLVTFQESDLYDRTQGFPSICRGLFNSGSYVLNLKKMRDAKLDLNDYVSFSQQLCELSGQSDTSHIYWGDQGFLSAAFVGDIKIYNYPAIRNLWHMPYNFCLWYYDRVNVMPDYDPAIIHFAGTIKPWKMKYPVTLKHFSYSAELHLFKELKIGQAEWFYLWHEYAALTDKLLTELGY